MQRSEPDPSAEPEKKKQRANEDWATPLEQMRADFMKQLPSEGKSMVLREGMSVMLLANLNVEMGAYRGAIATVRNVVFVADELQEIHLTLPNMEAPFIMERKVEVIEGPHGGRCSVRGGGMLYLFFPKAKRTHPLR